MTNRYAFVLLHSTSFTETIFGQISAVFFSIFFTLLTNFSFSSNSLDPSNWRNLKDLEIFSNSWSPFLSQLDSHLPLLNAQWEVPTCNHYMKREITKTEKFASSRWWEESGKEWRWTQRMKNFEQECRQKKRRNTRKETLKSWMLPLCA